MGTYWDWVLVGLIVTNNFDICDFLVNLLKLIIYRPCHGIGRGGHESRSDSNLVLCSRSNVETFLSHDWHVQMMNQSQLQTLRSLVVESIII